MKRQYVAKSNSFNTVEKFENAPIFKTVFDWDYKTCSVEISVAGLYRIFLNGNDITKGVLAPYICNPDDIVYYDKYNISSLVRKEKNVLCIILGNGFANSCTNMWEFNKAPFRSAPKMFVSISNEIKEIISSKNFYVADSPIIFDDLRFGEYYDARLEIKGVFTNSDIEKEFYKPILVDAPKGEYKECFANPIKKEKVLSPIKIFKGKEGYFYDFGEDNAGIYKLKIKGESGQKITLTFSETIKDGVPDMENITFKDDTLKDMVQKDIYVCKDGYQEYIPSFTYHGFRYIYVEGITEKQATKNLLEYIVIHSDIKKRANFCCSDKIVNKIQDCVLRSDLSNFYYFITDCPQREKNGWTGDSNLSAEQIFYNFDAVESIKEWLINFVKAQNSEGAFPGIVPTSGWGFKWGNGPVWDGALFELLYQIYKFNGDLTLVKQFSKNIIRYFNHIKTKLNIDNLIEIGIGDWCEAGTSYAGQYHTPLEVTDSISTIDNLNKTIMLFNLSGLQNKSSSLLKFKSKLIRNFRKKYVKNAKIICNTQTAQAIAIKMGIFTNKEKPKAERYLLRLIRSDGNHFKVGVYGAKYLFDVLSDMEKFDLAFKLVTQKSFPSYGQMVSYKETTTLWESFHEVDFKNGEFKRYDGEPNIDISLNHHFWGSISAWFYKYLAGINVVSKNILNIAPKFVKKLNCVEADFENGNNKIKVRWERVGTKIDLIIDNMGFNGVVKFSDKEFNLENGKKVYGVFE